MNTSKNRGCFGCCRGTWQQRENYEAKPEGKDTHSWRLLGWSREHQAQGWKSAENEDSTWGGQAHKRQLSKTNFYIIKKRKAGSIHRHRDGEASQVPSAPQRNAMLSMRGQALRPVHLSNFPNFKVSLGSGSDFVLWGGQYHQAFRWEGEPLVFADWWRTGNHGLPGYVSALGRGEKASTSSQYTQTLPALDSISSSQRYKKEKDRDG